MDMIEHRVRERAYYIWEDEGRGHGRADAHWLQAEAEFAATGVETTPAAAVSADKAAQAPAARKPASAKASAPKATTAKAAVAKTATAKAAASKAAAKVPVKAKKAPRASDAGIALH